MSLTYATEQPEETRQFVKDGKVDSLLEFAFFRPCVFAKWRPILRRNSPFESPISDADHEVCDRHDRRNP